MLVILFTSGRGPLIVKVCLEKKKNLSSVSVIYAIKLMVNDSNNDKSEKFWARPTLRDRVLFCAKTTTYLHFALILGELKTNPFADTLFNFSRHPATFNSQHLPKRFLTGGVFIPIICHERYVTFQVLVYFTCFFVKWLQTKILIIQKLSWNYGPLA